MFEYIRLKKNINKLLEENDLLLKRLNAKSTKMNDLKRAINYLETSKNNLELELENSKYAYESKSRAHLATYEENTSLKMKNKDLLISATKKTTELYTINKKYKNLQEAYRNLQKELSEYKKALDNQNEEIKNLNNELKFFKRENTCVMELCKDYVVIPVDEYEELQDAYQKLSETEEQRKNMSQAYEDEYQTRLALQEENKTLTERLDNLNRCIDKLKTKNYYIKKENKKLKDQIKRNLNPYGGYV